MALRGQNELIVEIKQRRNIGDNTTKIKQNHQHEKIEEKFNENKTEVIVEMLDPKRKERSQRQIKNTAK